MKTAMVSLERSASLLFTVPLLLLLAGCAGRAPLVRPADFSLHSADQHFDLHWMLEQDGGVVRAVGLVETRASTFADLTLELRGLDKSGRIVSHGLGVVRPGFGREAQPFAVELRPRGQEDRFELRVSSFTLNGFRGGKS